MTRALQERGDVVLQLRGITKSFGDIRALDQVDLLLREKQILGLIGENGAGKTTLMNILYGLYQADGGEIYLDQQKVAISSPRDAIRRGIGMVHQKFLQVDSYTVTENVVLGTKVSRRGTGMDLGSAVARVADLAAKFGLEVDPRAAVGSLPVGTRQRVEILKALYRDVRVLVLDEPTSSLTPQEVDALFRSLKLMVKQGLSIVFITHKIREVLAVCDSVTVLRAGRNVTTVERGEASEKALALAMVGETSTAIEDRLTSERSVVPAVAGTDDNILVLEVDSLSVAGGGDLPIANVSIALRKGEILGIGGVAGNGQRQLLEAILGIRPKERGSVRLQGRDVTEATTREMLDAGVAYVPEDRHHGGILPASSVAENLVLGHHRSDDYRRGPFLDRRAINRTAQQLIEEFGIRTSIRAAGAGLSGGNIQRVLLARALAATPTLIVAHNPTQGLDVRSVAFVHERIRMCRNRGAAGLIVSEDIDELMLLADRIAVMYGGAIAGILEQPDFDRYRIGRLMAGTRSGE